MQAAILKFPDNTDAMPYSEKRFNDLAKKVESISTQLGSSTKESAPEPKTPWTAWIPLVVVATTILLGIATISVTLAIHFDNKISTVSADVRGLDKRLTKLEEAVKAISSQQSDQTQKLIHDLLATAATTKDLPTAAKSVEVASQLTARLRQERRPAPPEFFKDVFESARNTKQAELRTVAFKAQLQLAEYRSSLLTLPVPSSTFNCVNEAAQRESFPSSFSFTNMTLAGCVVTLDGRSLDNVVFVNARIIYNGGPLHLHAVLFVNCTFDVPPNPHGSQLLEYAALDQHELSLGTS
jgi:outer membrane murein-binding lipoprotein Lpp